MNKLDELHTDIEARVQAIRNDYPNWLCRKGCDGCCRRLAEVPRVTAAEWDWLKKGLLELSAQQLQKIGQDIAALTEQSSGPLICPLLNQSTGACNVYLHRPVACRTYGFYVQREHGLYCKDIETRVDCGDLSEVVWGNQEAVDRRLSNMGDTRELTTWFQSWKNGIDCF